MDVVELCDKQAKKLEEKQKKVVIKIPTKEDLKKSREGESAKYFLTDSMLLDRLLKDGLDNKIVGEDEVRKVIFICAMGGLVVNGNRTSYNLMVNSESGAGKDYVVDNVLKIIPSHKIVKRTRITPTVFNYWHNSKFEPEWTWDGKVLYLEDCSNAVLNHDVFKVMCSSGSQVTVTINQMAIDINIVGKPVVIITSASASPNPELLRRFVIVNLDESKEQTKEIVEKWADVAANGYSNTKTNDYHESLSYLMPVKVRVPFAKDLTKVFNFSHIVIRTHFGRFIDFIKSSTAIHQFQREKDSDGFLLAQGEDYDIARDVLLKTTSNPIMIPLTKNQKKILDIIKNLPTKYKNTLNTEEETGYSVTDLEPKITFISSNWLRNELDKLVNFGFLAKKSEARDSSKKDVMVYIYKTQIDINIPKWKEITKQSNTLNTSNTSNILNQVN